MDRTVLRGESAPRTPFKVEVLRTSDGRLVVVGAPEAPALHSDRHADAAH